ncbi:MAG: hypothetical protein H0U16_09195 [Actinobacteria bacterium]|nr:hypothetical protein [Actinomycetota bacterium]
MGDLVAESDEFLDVLLEVVEIWTAMFLLNLRVEFDVASAQEPLDLVRPRIPYLIRE